jgi:DNA-binding transcriptional LysR family regulator
MRRLEPRGAVRLRADPQDLRLFLAVFEAGSITAASQRVHLSLAAASGRLQALEASIGTPLFDRSRRGVQPTPAGQVFARHARAVLLQLEQLGSELAPFVRGERGTVRLLCNTAALSEYLLEPLARFLALHPHIDVQLDEAPSLDIVEAIREGKALAGVLADSADTARLAVAPFREDRLVLLVPAASDWAGRDEVTFSEALAQPFVGVRESALRSFLDAQAARAGQAVRYRLLAAGLEDACRLVARGIGLAALPLRAAQRLADPAATRIVPLSDAWATRRLLLCAQSFEALPLEARRLVEMLRDDASH